MIELAIAIQQIAAPTFEEAARAQFMRGQFEQLGLRDIHQDSVGNLYARLPGKNSTLPPLVLSAHLDTVFPADTPLTVQRSAEYLQAPGIGDNSVALAALCESVLRLRAQNHTLAGDLWLVANTAEEGLGNLRGITAVCNKFGAQPRAYIVLEGIGLGEVTIGGIGSQRYQISAHTAGGHSWSSYGQPSAIHHLARLITALDALPVPSMPRASLNVGCISGGFSVNTIAAEASLLLDLRSEDARTLQALCTQVENLTAKAATAPGVDFRTQIIGQRPAGNINGDHWLVALAAESLRSVGIPPTFGAGSTDANLPLSRGLPSICIGLTIGERAHSLEENIRIAPLEQGMQALMYLLRHAWRD
ncbi:MAG: M20/M25/M40 family metallo-hydrolase [Anaerolineales bacterium]